MDIRDFFLSRYWEQLQDVGLEDSSVDLLGINLEKAKNVIQHIRYPIQFTTQTFIETGAELFETNQILAEEIRKLQRENEFLRKEISEIKTELGCMRSEKSSEKVIVLKQISREQAKQEIKELFASGRTLYFSDIAEELKLDIKLVVEICKELQEENEIGVDSDSMEV